MPIRGGLLSGKVRSDPPFIEKRHPILSICFNTVIENVYEEII